MKKQARVCLSKLLTVKTNQFKRASAAQIVCFDDALQIVKDSLV